MEGSRQAACIGQPNEEAEEKKVVGDGDADTSDYEGI